MWAKIKARNECPNNHERVYNTALVAKEMHTPL
jgi:hypothetical protein